MPEAFNKTQNFEKIEKRQTERMRGEAGGQIREQYSGHVICLDKSGLIVCRECGQVRDSNGISELT